MARAQRPQRTPIIGRSILGVRGKEPGFSYRIVNDVDDRIESFKERGYEVVTDNSVQVGDKRVASPTKEGTPMQISVGNGVKAYLMRIDEDLYKEDQEAKNKQLLEQDESMKREASRENNYGGITIR